MGFEKAPNLTELVPGTPAASFQAHGVQPELCPVAVALNVDVRRFLQAVRPASRSAPGTAPPEESSAFAQWAFDSIGAKARSGPLRLVFVG